MKTFTPIDLAQLPDPKVVEQLDYEQILEQRKAALLALWPEAERAEIAARMALESDPLNKLLQENAYRELVWRQRVNEAALATLLAKARGADLDQVAANYNVRRLVVTPATDQAPAVMEGDDALRERAQMAFEGLSTAGPRNAYVYHARSADGRVADATAVSPAPAEVVVTVQALAGDGSAPADLLAKVLAALSDEDVRPVADRVTVQGAQILPYSVTATLYLASTGPEAEPILAAAEARCRALVNARRRLGVEVSASAVHAALHVEGVRKVQLNGWADIVPTAYQAGYCTGIHLSLASL
ncbi:baseplate J/gp47 family protein [Pseudomonas sp. zfem003]|uniref:baseplate J/gp47 family protein n=1 Tax=Pseudomonas sp. zfem003 TaxID=3078198 RepID=UPI00292766D2|nr:baseplate J/gp47 family protein [Pseudomonas sp. zfem003]MDU9395406.1 baseplate J/gp47 family protein [Pseudomonas sp. zfem003]